MKKFKTQAGIGVVASILGLGMLSAASAANNTYTVTNGVIDSAAVAGTLRWACAQCTSGTNTIVFDPSVTRVQLTNATGSIVFDAQSQPGGYSVTVDGDGKVTIDATGKSGHFSITRIDMSGNTRVFKGLTFIKANGSAVNSDTRNQGVQIVITNCVFSNNVGAAAVNLGVNTDTNAFATISGCNFNANSYASGSGGAIAVQRNCLIQNCTFSNNAAYFGGVLYLNPSAGQTNWVLNCDFFTNSAAGPSGNGKDGGGAAVLMTGNGNVVMDRCVIRNNITQNNGWGGALEYWDGYSPSTGLLTISNSVIIANSGALHGGGCRFEAATRMVNCLIASNDESGVSGSSGGGLSVDKGSGGETTMPAVYLINTTISGNKCASGSRGGGVDLRANGPTYIYNCTIATNGPAGATGGGVGVRDNPSSLSIYSTIVANNSGSDLYTGGAIALLDHCLIGINVGYSVTTSKSTLVNTNALLSPLADNGGPVLSAGRKLLTHAIGTTSPAYNAGSNTLSLAYDQRGSPYVREWPSAGQCDIGAYEYSVTAVSKGTVVLLR